MGLVLYLIIVAIFIILSFLIYRKYQDKNFITGIVFTGVLNCLPFLAFPSLYFFIGYFLGVIFGFVAGYFNLKIKLGIMSGALGIFLGYLIFGGVSPLGFLIFYSLFYILIVILPSTLCGAIGGAIGSKIRMRSEVDNISKSEEEGST
jgi:hypothetical protein